MTCTALVIIQLISWPIIVVVEVRLASRMRSGRHSNAGSLKPAGTSSLIAGQIRLLKACTHIHHGTFKSNQTSGINMYAMLATATVSVAQICDIFSPAG